MRTRMHTHTAACARAHTHTHTLLSLQPQAAKKKDKLMTMDPKEITYEMVNRKLREIVMSRGRRGTDKQEQVRSACTRPCAHA